MMFPAVVIMIAIPLRLLRKVFNKHDYFIFNNVSPSCESYVTLVIICMVILTLSVILVFFLFIFFKKKKLRMKIESIEFCINSFVMVYRNLQ